MNNNIDLNTDMKSLDSGDFQQIKPLVMLFYKKNNDELTNDEKLLLNNLDINNLELYTMLKTFSLLLKETNQTEKDISGTIYLTFRKVYIEFNQKQQELKSNIKNGELNNKKFPNIEHIVATISLLNNKFQDTEAMKYHQYYSLNEVESFVDKLKQSLKYSNTKEFKNELETLKVLAPLIQSYINKCEKNCLRYIKEVNEICNDTIMEKSLYENYSKAYKSLENNLHKLKQDFDIIFNDLDIQKLQTKTEEIKHQYDEHKSPELSRI